MESEVRGRGEGEESLRVSAESELPEEIREKLTHAETTLGC